MVMQENPSQGRRDEVVHFLPKEVELTIRAIQYHHPITIVVQKGSRFFKDLIINSLALLTSSRVGDIIEHVFLWS
jgi:hypothetical protein